MSDGTTLGAGSGVLGAGGEATPPETGGRAPGQDNPDMGKQPETDGAPKPEGGDGGHWYDGLPAEQHELLGRYKSSDEALAGLIASAKDRDGMIRVPGENATDEEKAAFAKALGVPDKAEGYAMPEIEGLPEGVSLEDETTQSYREEALKLGLTPAQFQGLAKWATQRGVEAASGDSLKAYQTAEIGVLQKEYGTGTAKVLDDAHAAAMALGGKDLIEALGEAGMSSAVIKAFAKVAPLVTEGRMKDGSGGPGRATRVQLREMMNDPRYADPMRRDPAFVKQVDEGYRALSGGK